MEEAKKAFSSPVAVAHDVLADDGGVVVSLIPANQSLRKRCSCVGMLHDEFDVFNALFVCKVVYRPGHQHAPNNTIEPATPQEIRSKRTALLDERDVMHPH